MGEQPLSIRNLIIRSLRQNLVPGVVLWITAVLLYLSYVFLSPVREFLEFFQNLKSQSGVMFAAVSTGIFGGLIPFAVLAFRGEFKTLYRLVTCLLFYVLFWAWKGIEIDLFYQLQAKIFGDVVSFEVIAKKVALDMLVFSAIYAVPCIAVFNVWKDQEFDFERTKRTLNREYLLKRIPTMIAANWFVWIPSVSIVYSMPLTLQVVMFNLVLCFWVLVLTVIGES